MPAAIQKSIQNAKGKFLAEDGKFSTAKNADVLTGRAATEKRVELGADAHTIVDAPADAIARVEKLKAKAANAKIKAKAVAAKEKAKAKAEKAKLKGKKAPKAVAEPVSA